MSNLTEVTAILTNRAQRDNDDWIALVNPNSPVEDEFHVQPAKWGYREGRYQKVLHVQPDGSVERYNVKALYDGPANQKDGVQFNIGQTVVIRFSDGTETEDVVTDLSKRQVTTATDLKFKRSDGTGWGDNDAVVVMDAIETTDDAPEPIAIEGAMEGDQLRLSNGETVSVTATSKRQVRAGGYKFKYDGTGWGSQDVFVAGI